MERFGVETFLLVLLLLLLLLLLLIEQYATLDGDDDPLFFHMLDCRDRRVRILWSMCTTFTLSLQAAFYVPSCIRAAPFFVRKLTSSAVFSNYAGV